MIIVIIWACGRPPLARHHTPVQQADAVFTPNFPASTAIAFTTSMTTATQFPTGMLYIGDFGSPAYFFNLSGKSYYHLHSTLGNFELLVHVSAP